MILVVDNYDSFTYNLVQVMAAAGAAVEVVRNDAADAATLLARRPAGVVLSPGPGRPEDSAVTMEILERRPEVPLLGVCLGHQALGVTFGARVDRARHLMHGKTSPVRHDGSGVFAGLPDPFEATRYHSLEVVPGTLPPELEPVAWSDDGCLQGMRHRELPWWGVQFHPESILTSAGPRLLANFLRLCGELPAGGESAGEEGAIERLASGSSAARYGAAPAGGATESGGGESESGAPAAGREMTAGVRP